MMRLPCLIWFASSVVSSSSVHLRVLGFEYNRCRCASERIIRRTSHSPSLSCATEINQSTESCCSAPTVLNPVTKRKIRLGGPTYNELIKQGRYVQHLGSLQTLNLQALRRYQLKGSDHPARVSEPAHNYWDDSEMSSIDQWYCITPLVVSPQTQGGNKHALDDSEARRLREELLFVHKPSGLHCVPPRDTSVDSLSAKVATLYPSAKPCHRLDRDTSGTVVFGLTKETHSDISKQFEHRTTSKIYTALVAGRPYQDYGMIDMPIGKQKTNEGFSRWAIGGEKARSAITKYRVDCTFVDAETGAKFSRVSLEPKTGRGHQLRLHMKAIGCPILGDTIHSEGTGVAACSPRLCLHATKLQVDWNGLRLEAESVAPF